MNDLGVKFNTPTVNLFLKPKDFNKFLLNFDKYINMDLEDVMLRLYRHLIYSN